ncbi:hypothetical protein PSN45_003714 [Yamadazyma tenuis]|uniref:LETM1-domain-containing protein n=1 Tax=Candida tenuis (strain ATCC 10573 / BCRC 21748 / CBS 615 / JCM 9827 / NBRC 10315 / NRRL Y-1498 / VKM Y-70) TaxID=590646 RepID=G3B3I9_CANTC|nr:uncharacterized protein CANTEDRAFT_114220 [Yamadazyma tenuis ATCC 10573]XP_006686718.1 LETM1-domain-containing protein [Yamadazyma tenuis ATCC 10573]EGV64403.1 hypothetical protein CANTEDRAFT_114220 [Yamadazyma tenuis ATCC 10573]EGV64404.1 LETM1-domain-containing protein [Yamadazyma tenuis ATCC 10573]WEJ96178.1 hypothetical protein PSN45_003714 [Yamadazyma tenuis]
MIKQILLKRALPQPLGAAQSILKRGLMTRPATSAKSSPLHRQLTLNNRVIQGFIRMNSQAPKPQSDGEPAKDKADGAVPPKSGSEAVVEVAQKKTLWEKVKHEAHHYWDGTKLLGYEIKVSTKLMVKVFAGYGLSRRESNQLQRTLADLVRLVPFAALILIPFAELLIPVIVRIFPNFLPSTYESTSDRKKKNAKLYKAKKAASQYIKQTMEESGLKLSKINDKEREAFVSFFDTLSMGKQPSREHLTQVARLFKNDQVLDNLSRPQLLAMAKYMNITPFGTDSILRYQIRHTLLNIIKDDKAIDYEGVESLTIQELKYACQQRGIKTVNVSPGRLRDDLTTWLDLRLRQKIPSTLLILSSTYTYGENSHDIESYYDALLAVLSAIPDEVYNVAKLELSDDSKLKLDILKEQDELINEENLREKDTVTHVKDEIKLDELEEAAEGGIQSEPENVSAAVEEAQQSTKSEETKSEETKDQPEPISTAKSSEKSRPTASM